MATLKDVAIRAGVSTTTVSHALNGTRFVQPETAARVFAAVHELGYSPNTMARGLRTGNSRTIGIIAVGAMDWFFAESLAGIEETCYARGYEIYLGFVERGFSFARPPADRSQEREFVQVIMGGRVDAPSPDEGGGFPGEEKEEQLIAKMLAREVDGLVLNVWGPDEAVARAVRGTSAKLALYHRQVQGVEADVFGSDEYGACRKAVESLLSQGHRRIGMIYTPSRRGHRARERFRAYSDALHGAKVAIDAGLIINGGYYLETAADATRVLLSLPDPPTAIWFWGDLLAVAGIAVARERGLSVPRDLSVIGYDDNPIAAWVHPRLSSVRQERLGLGAAMAARLIDRIEGTHEGPPEQVLLPTRYIERESVAPAPIPSAR